MVVHTNMFALFYGGWSSAGAAAWAAYMRGGYSMQGVRRKVSAAVTLVILRLHERIAWPICMIQVYISQ